MTIESRLLACVYSAAPLAVRFGLALCLAAALVCGPASAQESGNAAERVFAKVSPSVVVIVVKDASGSPALQGSGVVVATGHLITNCHVAQGGPGIEIHSGGKAFSATIQYADPDRDLCELSVSGLSAPAVAVASVKSLKVGQQAFAVGAPEGLDLTISDGIVSSLRPVGSSFVIQTTAAISPGSSGGGLFDDQGRLMGVTAFQFVEGQNLNFALPADWIASLPSRSSDELSFIASATSLGGKKEWDALTQLSLEHTRGYPRDEGGWHYLGDAYGGLGQYDKAVDAYRQAIQLKPDDMQAWLGLGAAYDLIGQNDKAVEAFKRAVQVSPEDVGARVALGAEYRTLGQSDEAVEAFKQAIKLKADDAQAWAGLGFAYGALRQWDEAAEAYKQAIKLKSDYALAWVGLVITYCSQGDRTSAISAYQALEKIDPEKASKLLDTCIAP